MDASEVCISKRASQHIKRRLRHRSRLPPTASNSTASNSRPPPLPVSPSATERNHPSLIDPTVPTSLPDSAEAFRSHYDQPIALSSSFRTPPVFQPHPLKVFDLLKMNTNTMPLPISEQSTPVPGKYDLEKDLVQQAISDPQTRAPSLVAAGIAGITFDQSASVTQAAALLQIAESSGSISVQLSSRPTSVPPGFHPLAD